MDVETIEVLQNFLISMTEAAVSAKDFVVEQIPLVLQEVLTFYTVIHSVTLILATILLIIVFRLSFVSYVRLKVTNARCWEDEILFHVFITAVAAAIPMTLFICNLIQLIKVLVAPRLYLIEYAADLASKGS